MLPLSPGTLLAEGGVLIEEGRQVFFLGLFFLGVFVWMRLLPLASLERILEVAL